MVSAGLNHDIGSTWMQLAGQFLEVFDVIGNLTRAPRFRQGQTPGLLVQTQNASRSRCLRHRQTIQPDGAETQDCRGLSQVQYGYRTYGYSHAQGFKNRSLLERD